MEKLYELAGDFDLLYSQIDSIQPDDENYEELVTAFLDTLEGMEGAFDMKAEQIALIIKNLEAMEFAIKLEEERLAKRRKSKQYKADRIKEYLKQNMQVMGKKKIETPKATVQLRQSTRCAILNEQALIAFAITNGLNCVHTKQQIDKKETKQLIQEGADLQGLAVLKAWLNLTVK